MSRGIIDRAQLVGCDAVVGPATVCPRLLIFTSEAQVEDQTTRRGWITIEDAQGNPEQHYCPEHAPDRKLVELYPAAMAAYDALPLHVGYTNQPWPTTLPGKAQP